MIKKIIRKLIPYKIYLNIQDTVNYFNSLKYIGNKYHCPLCHGIFNSFLSAGLKHDVIKQKNIIGAGYRENAVCPRCLSYDRERLIYLYLNEYRKYIFHDNVKILHIAPEKNLNKLFSKFKNIDYTSADLNHPSAKVKMDITNIIYEDNVFDVILCNHVLEHVPDDKKAISELYRVMKAGAFGILQVPISYMIEKTEENLEIDNDKDRIKNYGQEDHVRLYGRDYLDRLKSVGFKVNVIDFASELEVSKVERYSLLKDEKIFLVSK